MMRPLLLVAMVLWARPAGALGLPDSGSACQAAMAATEVEAGLPARLLLAIATIESGRRMAGGVVSPWPWTINVAGVGHFYDTKAEAIAAVRTAQAAGVQSIDVGCMQINLLSHPQAFATLDDAFDPAANVRYGASFLGRLHASTANWTATVAAYHSLTPDRGADYARRVAVIWPLAGSDDGHGRVPAAAALAVRVRSPDVDPQHVLTPEFRARMVEAAAFRRSRDLAMGIPTQPAGVGLLTERMAGSGRRAGWRRMAAADVLRGSD